MNDVDQAFMHQEKALDEQRAFANKHLPTLAKLVDPQEDAEFKYFVQEMVDHYMANVCRLGRR